MYNNTPSPSVYVVVIIVFFFHIFSIHSESIRRSCVHVPLVNGATGRISSPALSSILRTGRRGGLGRGGLQAVIETHRSAAADVRGQLCPVGRRIERSPLFDDVRGRIIIIAIIIIRVYTFFVFYPFRNVHGQR